MGGKKWLVLLLLGSGCTATLTPEQAKVRVTNDPEAARGCTRIGDVSGDSQWEDEAFREVQRHAAKIGADTVVITWTSPQGKRKRGEAFRCSQPH